MRKFLTFFLLSALFFFGSGVAHATYPPNPGDKRCGIIQNGRFYSSDGYYAPPNGTPAQNGNFRWVQISGSCSSIIYDGVKYNPKRYEWKYVPPVNVPLDKNIYLLLLLTAPLGFFMIRKKMAYTFNYV